MTSSMVHREVFLVLTNSFVVIFIPPHIHGPWGHIFL